MESDNGAVAGALVAGKYRIKKRIGAGGMGAVYEGEHVEIGKRVAIKVIEHEHAQSDELAKRFKREARAASAVESEHIVQVFDVGTDERVGLYMVMEMLVGEDLSSRLEKNGGRLPVEDVVAIGMQSSRGLAKAHAAGVVHRDLKPANLFLTTREDGTTCVKILDFGISKLARKDSGDTGPSHTLTRAGSVMGTPMYMSPEQAQGLAVDARADIWSLAVALYEALAGRTPFDQRDTYEQMIVQIVTQRPKSLAVIAPWVPPAIVSVLERALAHDLNERTPDIATFGKQLAEAARLPAPSPSSSSLASGVAGSVPSSQRGSAAHARAMAQGTDETALAPPPTNVGVVVARQEMPAKRGIGMWLGIGAAVAAVAAGGIVMATSAKPKQPTAGAGLVADRPPEPIASAMTSASTTFAPLTSASAAPAASAAAASSIGGPGTGAGVRPAGAAGGARPTATPTATTTATNRSHGGLGLKSVYE